MTDRTAAPLPEPRRVGRLVLHPGWDRLQPLNNITAGHDLAVLELALPAVLGAAVWPVCLPGPPHAALVRPGAQLTSFGFGVREISEAGRRYAEIVTEAALRVAEPEDCRAAWQLTGDQICAAGDGAGQEAGQEAGREAGRVADTCSGDSGGGLVTDGVGSAVLMGVVSFGERECGAGRPGVYTNLLSHAAWLRTVIAGESCGTEDGRTCQFPFIFAGTKYQVRSNQTFYVTTGIMF